MLDEYLATALMTATMRTTTATVHCAVYRTDSHALVNLVYHMNDHNKQKRTEQNLIVHNGKSEAELNSTSASVELTQPRHSHSKQLFQGGTDFSVSTGRVKKLHTLLVSLYF